MSERPFRAGSHADEALLLQDVGLGPEDAARHPWLVSLLRGYLLLRDCLAADLAKDGREPVCDRGCDLCCHQPIPVTPPEVVGIALLLKRHGYPERRSLPPPGACVFLEHGACSIYPLRPVACRRYLVFGRRCAPGEDPTSSRPGDVLRPSKHALLHALRASAAYYAHLGLIPRGVEPDMRFFQSRTILLHEVDWSSFRKG